MYGKTIFVVILAVALISVAMPVNAEHNDSSTEYVGAFGVTGAVGGRTVCQDIEGSGSPGVGGACSLTRPDLDSASEITVADDQLANIEFSWACRDADGGNTGSSGDGTGSATADPEEGADCTHISVFLNLPATTGTIKLE